MPNLKMKKKILKNSTFKTFACYKSIDWSTDLLTDCMIDHWSGTVPWAYYNPAWKPWVQTDYSGIVKLSNVWSLAINK